MKINDAQLGEILLISNNRAKKVTARYRNGYFRITHPARMKQKELEDVINQMRSRLMKLKDKSPNNILSPTSKLNLSCFNVIIKESSYKNYYHKLTQGQLIILCPENTIYEDESTQLKLRAIIDQQLKIQAQRILPIRVKYFAQKYQFEYSNVKINKSVTRWGSCSSHKNINLSLRCMLLPDYLIDLVILHELCHTKEMNHGENFWKILDEVTDGKSKTLTNELNNFRSIY